MDFLLLLFGGVCFGAMVSLNGRLAAYWNVFEVSFLVHLIGAVLLLAAAGLVQKGKIRLAGAPLYVYFVGFLGVALVVTSSLGTAHIGAAPTMALSVAGQLVSSSAIDHFGWFHVPVTRFRSRRIPAFCIVLAGLLLLICA